MPEESQCINLEQQQQYDIGHTAVAAGLKLPPQAAAEIGDENNGGDKLVM